MNPYDFVPLGSPSRRLPAPGHHLLPDFGGSIHARLTTLGPFLIAEQRERSEIISPLGRGLLIPGSSFKGMLRTIAEMVGGGCISTSSSLYHRGAPVYKHAKVPGGFAPCSSPGRLCVTCRMFGTLAKGAAWKGMVEPGEARWQGDGAPRQILDLHITVGQPKPEHHSFYTRNGEIRGRKAYYHHPDKLIKSAPAHQVAFGARQTSQARALEPGQVYEFSVWHRGLESDSYALLLYALFLEDGLAHKLGWGKPMGLGSVRIEPVAIEEVALQARYRRGGAGAATRVEGAGAEELVARKTAGLRARRDEVMTAFRRLMAFPGPSGVEWRYPSYDWFKQHPRATLEEFNRGTRAR